MHREQIADEGDQEHRILGWGTRRSNFVLAAGTLVTWCIAAISQRYYVMASDISSFDAHEWLPQPWFMVWFVIGLLCQTAVTLLFVAGIHFRACRKLASYGIIFLCGYWISASLLFLFKVWSEVGPIVE